MGKILHFTSGLPRSCSTLLQNLLAQNPRVHATPTSTLHEFGFQARRAFNSDVAGSANKAELETMYCDYIRAGCENAFNSITDRPVVVDKSRAWVGYIDQLFKVWPDAKVLVPVRDVRGIVCSMEKKFRAHPSVLTATEVKNAAQWTTLDKRVQGWLSHPPVGIAIERVHEAASRFKDKLHFVHAEDLTEDPQGTMNGVWEYLGEEPFIHNTQNVEQYTQEHDVGFPYGDHEIRPEVKPLKPDWHDILGRQTSQVLQQKFNWINEL